MSEYEISTDRTRLDVAAIHAFLTQSYWSPGIPRATVERAIANSLCFGAFWQGQQVGFARVVTDKTTSPTCATSTCSMRIAAAGSRSRWKFTSPTCTRRTEPARPKIARFGS